MNATKKSWIALASSSLLTACLAFGSTGCGDDDTGTPDGGPTETNIGDTGSSPDIGDTGTVTAPDSGDTGSSPDIGDTGTVTAPDSGDTGSSPDIGDTGTVTAPDSGDTGSSPDIGDSGTVTAPDSGDTGTGDSGNTDLPGVVHSSVTTLPGGEPTCCEHEWTIRDLQYHPGATTPRRMYYAACDTGSATPKMFVSLSLGENAAHPTEDPSSGAILRTELNAATGQMESTGVARQFPECIWMEGIAVSGDCMTIATLCRRHYGDDDYDFDSLATHTDKDWMTQPDCADQEMWLYEWTNGDIESEPEKYVVHRAVGTSWEYGNNYLRFGETDNTYGIGVKARVFGGGGCHEADAFLVMDRTSHNLMPRGYSWACGTGHTLFNHPTFNPATSKYALLCGTDASNNGSPLGGMFLRIEDRSSNEFYDTNYSGLRIKGGVGALRPLAGGGYLGIIVGVEGAVTAQDAIPLEPPTSIGLVRFDATGTLVGDVNWVVQAHRKYLSYPQLAPLGNGRYLLGWGEMYDLDRTSEMNDDAYRIPIAYYVMEIDETGAALTPEQALEGAGWGEQDEMVPLGNGRVGWAYIPSPALADVNAPPSCNSLSLQLSVYAAAH